MVYQQDLCGGIGFDGHIQRLNTAQVVEVEADDEIRFRYRDLAEVGIVEIIPDFLTTRQIAEVGRKFGRRDDAGIVAFGLQVVEHRQRGAHRVAIRLLMRGDDDISGCLKKFL